MDDDTTTNSTELSDNHDTTFARASELPRDNDNGDDSPSACVVGYPRCSGLNGDLLPCNACLITSRWDA